MADGDKRTLYEQVILDHNKNPRNFCEMENPSCEARGYNALCGDQFTIYLKIDDGKISEVTFQGCGCAISKSSASLMTLALKGKTREEAQALFDRFHNMVTSEPSDPADIENLGKLQVLCGVREYPVRVKCATLAWHTMLAALQGKKDSAVSTE
jgi:nitrogen fixation protein NifU and related proteins